MWSGVAVPHADVAACVVCFFLFSSSFASGRRFGSDSVSAVASDGGCNFQVDRLPPPRELIDGVQ